MPKRKRGRAGRAFDFGEPGVPDEAAANSLAADRRGPPQDNQAQDEAPSEGASCGCWIRARGQREPALQGTGRLNGSARMARLVQGWDGYPGHRRPMRLNSTGPPGLFKLCLPNYIK